MDFMHRLADGGKGGSGGGWGGRGTGGGGGEGGGGHIREPHLLTNTFPTQEVRLIVGDFVDEPEQSLHVAHVSVALLIRQPEQLPP